MEQIAEKFSNWLQYWIEIVHRVYVRLMVQWMVIWPEPGNLGYGYHEHVFIDA